VALTCSADADCDHQETLDVSSGDRYYLVVPQNPFGEGSYGLRSDAPSERPTASTEACAALQDLSCL
jgi:hypothetical protein